MKCPELEDLIAFAVSPLNPAHENLASHVYACRSCREIVLDAHRGLLAKPDKGGISTAEIRNLLQGRMKREPDSRWEKLIAKITSFLENQTLPKMPPMGATAFSFSALQSQQKDADERPSLEICFEANVAEGSDAYWKARLVIPAGAKDLSLLEVKVTDNCQNPKLGGKLSILGKNLFIINGSAYMTLGDFRNGIKETHVSYSDISGREIPGDLTIY